MLLLHLSTPRGPPPGGHSPWPPRAPGGQGSGRAPPPRGPGRGLPSRICSAGRLCAERRTGCGRPGLGRGRWGAGGTLAEPRDAPPPPGRRTHPGRAPAGKWQRQWKAAAQCAHRSASVPSPHTPHRAPGAGPCGADRTVTAAERGALPILRPPLSQGPAGAGPRGGARAGEGWFGVPAPEGGCLAAARGSQVARPRSFLVGLGPLQGWPRGLRNGTLQTRHEELGYMGTPPKCHPSPFSRPASFRVGCFRNNKDASPLKASLQSPTPVPGALPPHPRPVPPPASSHLPSPWSIWLLLAEPRPRALTPNPLRLQPTFPSTFPL